MDIAPNTQLIVISNCPLDNTYDHTIFFTGKEAQTAYFQGLAKYSFSPLTYQRVNKNTIRVQKLADLLYDCNYLMFKNTAYGDKWFYAFIKSVEYINNITAEITYEIDVIQTWFFDYSPDACYVEREHTYTDNIGDNTQPENVELGEYVASAQQKAGVSIPVSAEGYPGMLVIAATFDTDFNDTGTEVYNGLFAGITYNIFQGTSGYLQAVDFVQEISERGKQDGVLSMFLAPPFLASSEPMRPSEFDVVFQKEVTEIDGYTPKNNKLFTYPYNFLYVTNMQGAGAAFPYEFFNTAQCNFKVIGALSCNPSVVLIPEFYKGLSVNYDEKMTLSGWPQLPYNVDTFKAWLAQSASSLDVQALATGGSLGVAVGSAVAGGAVPIGGIIAGTAALGSMAANIYQHSIMPNQARGGGGATTMAAGRLLDFMLIGKSIRAEYAKIIDDYFTAFGYACNKVKVPNRNARPRWTYCKTRRCTLTGSVPADDMAKICEIYNAGITWWKNGDDIGNYSLDNSAITT